MGEAPPQAFDLLAEVRAAYRDIESYQDLGELEHTVDDGEASTSRLLFFETNLVQGRFSWRMHGEGLTGFEEHAVWQSEEETLVFNSRYRQYKPVSSIAAGLSAAIGANSFDALAVPLAVAGDLSALTDPEGAAVEGPEPCGDSTCWVLHTSRMAGSIEGELWVDRDSHLISEVHLRIEDQAAELSRRLAPAHAVSRSSAHRVTSFHLKHHPTTAPGEPFEPPEGASRVAEWNPENLDEHKPDPEIWLDVGLSEEITVALFSVVARFIDDRGEPLRNLQPEDLIVRIGQQEIPIDSLDWSLTDATATSLPPVQVAEARALARAGALETREPLGRSDGRLIAFFLQVDFEPSRIKGHLKLLPDIENLLNTLRPSDRVAVFSFDSHLKLWQDLSVDRGSSLQVIKEAISTDFPSARRAASRPSLFGHFDAQAAQAVASPERALEMVADTLAPLTGPKEIVYLGWGLGQYNGGNVQMTADYPPAVRALDAADATVFVLDVSQADNHSLELGLQQVAQHTGGTYAKTFHFASQAVERLTRTLTGHYVVHIDRSALPEAKGRLTIALRKRNGRALYRPLIIG